MKLRSILLVILLACSHFGATAQTMNKALVRDPRYSSANSNVLLSRDGTGSATIQCDFLNIGGNIIDYDLVEQILLNSVSLATTATYAINWVNYQTPTPQPTATPQSGVDTATTATYASNADTVDNHHYETPLPTPTPIPIVQSLSTTGSTTSIPSEAAVRIAINNITNVLHAQTADVATSALSITGYSTPTPQPTATRMPTATPAPTATLVPTATPQPAPTVVNTATPQSHVDFATTATFAISADLLDGHHYETPLPTSTPISFFPPPTTPTAGPFGPYLRTDGWNNVPTPLYTCTPVPVPTIVTYTAASVVVTYGTQTSGTYLTTQAQDYHYHEITEGTGVNCLQLEYTFTGVASINNVTYYGRYKGSASHEVIIEILNTRTAAYEQLAVLIDDANNSWRAESVANGTDYVAAGVVKIRFRHPQNGIATHILYVDYLVVQKLTSDSGIGGGTDHNKLHYVTDTLSHTGWGATGPTFLGVDAAGTPAMMTPVPQNTPLYTPTPAYTATPIPPVATATPRPTCTPIPAVATATPNFARRDYSEYAYYKMDETAASTVCTDAGGLYNMTYGANADTMTTTSLVGTGMQWKTGSPQYPLNLGTTFYNECLTADHEWAVAFWFRINTQVGGSTYLAYKSGTFSFRFHGGIAYIYVSLAGMAESWFACSLNTWTHFVMYRNKTGLYTAVNGAAPTLYSSGAGWNASLSNANAMHLINYYYTNGSDRAMDDVRFYSRSLSNGEIAALYAAGAGTANAGSVVHEVNGSLSIDAVNVTNISAPTGVFQIGSQAKPLTTVNIGQGTTAAAQSGHITIQPSDPTGTNCYAASMTIKAGRATGSGVGYGIDFYTYGGGGGSATTLRDTVVNTRIMPGGIMRQLFPLAVGFDDNPNGGPNTAYIQLVSNSGPYGYSGGWVDSSSVDTKMNLIPIGTSQTLWAWNKLDDVQSAMRQYNRRALDPLRYKWLRPNGKVAGTTETQILMQNTSVKLPDRQVLNAKGTTVTLVGATITSATLLDKGYYFNTNDRLVTPDPDRHFGFLAELMNAIDDRLSYTGKGIQATDIAAYDTMVLIEVKKRLLSQANRIKALEDALVLLDTRVKVLEGK